MHPAGVEEKRSEKWKKRKGIKEIDGFGNKSVLGNKTFRIGS